MNPRRICLAFAALSGLAAADAKPRVLILSGANNHVWKETTPAIRDEFWQSILVAPGAKPLASVTPDPAFNGSGKPENILAAPAKP